jgi:hypothetical protein
MRRSAREAKKPDFFTTVNSGKLVAKLTPSDDEAENDVDNEDLLEDAPTRKKRHITSKPLQDTSNQIEHNGESTLFGKFYVLEIAPSLCSEHMYSFINDM